MLLSPDGRRALATVVLIWTALSLWKFRVTSTLLFSAASSAPPVPQSSALPAGHPLAANTSYRPAPFACTRECGLVCEPEHAEIHCQMLKCCACDFCRQWLMEPERRPATAAPRTALAAYPPPVNATRRGSSGAVTAHPQPTRSLPTASKDDAEPLAMNSHRHTVALGVLTESRESARFKAMESTWLNQFDYVMVFESHTDSVARVQQIWKYVPTRLYERFPQASMARAWLG